MASTRTEGGRHRPAAARARCRPTLEILEDRRVPSTTPTVMQPPYWTPIVTPGAPRPSMPSSQIRVSLSPLSWRPSSPGETVSGVLITWGDGHISAGTILPLTNGFDEVLGSNDYANPGVYAYSVQITFSAGDTVAVQGTAVVLPPVVVAEDVNLDIAVVTAGTITFNAGVLANVTIPTLYGSGLTGFNLALTPSGNLTGPASTPGLIPPAGGTVDLHAPPPPVVVPPPAVAASGTTTAGSGHEPPVLIFTGFRPLPVAASEQVSWSSQREYGGNRSSTGQPSGSLPSSLVLQITANSQTTLINVSAVQPETTFPRPLRPLPIAASWVAAATQLGPLAAVFSAWGQSDPDVISAYWADESLAALGPTDGGDENPALAQLPQDSVTLAHRNVETYLQPLYQVAERGDVAVMDLSVPILARELPGPATERRSDEGSAPRQESASTFRRIGRTLLPAAAAWAILQAIYTGKGHVSPECRDRRRPAE